MSKKNKRTKADLLKEIDRLKMSQHNASMYNTSVVVNADSNPSLENLTEALLNVSKAVLAESKRPVYGVVMGNMPETKD